MAREHARTIRFLFGAACAVVVIAGARASTGILNPVLLAGFLTLLTQPILSKLKRLGGVAAYVVLLFVLVVGLVLIILLGTAVGQLVTGIPTYETQLDDLLASIASDLAARGIDIGGGMDSVLRGPEIARLAVGISGEVLRFVGSLGIALFIFVFMLGGVWEMERRAAREATDYNPLAGRFVAFAFTVRRYMRMRAILGLAAASLNFALFLLLDVDHAGLWALLSFAMSFIPNIGFFLAMLPPVLIALLSNGWVNALIVLAGFQIINSLIDNVIGPRYVGKAMEISPLLTFLSVIFWTWVLGPMGAVLCVPLTILVKDLTSDSGPAPQPATTA